MDSSKLPETPSILITGATGAIGSEVLKQLYSAYPHEKISVYIRDSKRNRSALKKFPGVKVHYGDITNSKVLESACAGIDLVYHFAGIIPPKTERSPLLVNKINVQGTQSVVDALVKVSPNAFLLFSSSVTVYGNRLDDPYINVNDPLAENTIDAYTKSKIEAERIIQNSSLNWGIFRLSAIMGIGNHKVSKIMFHVPLKTQMEITTVRDTARAFVNAIGKERALNNKVFNLGGGRSCQTTYEELVQSIFKIYGLGRPSFPPNSFATTNFHCGYFTDGDELETLLHFRRDTLAQYYNELSSSIPTIQRAATFVVNRPVKFFLAQLSEPKAAYKKQDREGMNRFFGNEV